MSLRRKVLAAIIVTLAVLTVLLYGLARVSVLQKFGQVEIELATENVDRIVGAINSAADALNQNCIDYAIWQDTYDYIENPDPQYIVSNFGAEQTTVDVSLLMLLDVSGHTIFEQTLLYSDASDPTKRVQVAGDKLLYDELVKLALLHSGQTGVVSIHGQYWMVAIQPILKGLNTSVPSNGYLIFANPFEESILPDIQEVIKLDLTLSPPQDTPRSHKVASTENDIWYLPIVYPNNDTISGGAQYIGLTGQPVFDIRFTTQRKIYNQGETSLWYMLWGALAVGLVTSLLGYATFEMLVMQPILRLDGRVRSIADSGRLSDRVSPEGAGEFTPLVNNINDMLEGLQQAHRSLLEGEERFRMMVESAPEAIVVIDATSGHCVEVNNKALSLFGYQSRSEFFQFSIYDLLDSAELATDESVKQQAERALSGATVEFETHIHRPDQNEIPCEVRLVRFPGQERRLLRATVIDISERKQAEARQLQAQKLESLGLLAGGVAHDFNNLLTGMLGQTSLALRKLPPENPARSHVVKAMSSAERAAIMTRQLLAYAGRGAVHFELIDLNRLVNETATLLETALARRIHLTIHTALNLPGIEADLGQLQQAVMNLVINAAEAIPAEQNGEIVVTTGVETLLDDVDYEYVGGQSPSPGDYVYLQVKDNGTGIEPHVLQRIFDPFFTTKATGNGLGLAATLGVVRRHYGAIQVKSTVGQGTEFQLLFPARTKPEIEPSSVVLPSDSEVNGIVLVIDDEQPVRETVRDILESSGIFVIDAESGRAGIEHFTRHHDEIDVVLIDMQMPFMNGAETLQALRKIKPNARVILSSGYSEHDPIRLVLQGENTLFLPKPYDSESLLRKVHQLITQP